MSQEKLIQLVKIYPILYNLADKDYKNIRKKDKAWEEIGKELNEKGDEVKKKWKNLRDSFARYLKANKTKTGQAATSGKKWQWSAQMEFFIPFLSFAKTSSNVTEILTEDAEISPIDIQTNQFEISFGSDLEKEVEKTKVPRKRKVSDMSQSSSVDCLINYFRTKNKNDKEDVDLLLEGHAKTIKKFSERRQAITKLKISQIVAEQELLNLEEQPSTSRTSFHSNSMSPQCEYLEASPSSVQNHNQSTEMYITEDYDNDQDRYSILVPEDQKQF